jgi:transketolase
VDASTGALGMGGSKSLGMALAARYKGLDYHTFCILGDGESEEGQVYEAASNAALVGADNLTWILNRNKAQQTAGTQDVSHVRYEEWFKALGWNVVVISGESAEPVKNRQYIAQLRNALLQAKNDAHQAGRPTIIIADTIKGKGVDFMEYKGQKPGEYKFHGVAPTDDELARALPLIEARLGTPDPTEMALFLKEGAVTAADKLQVNERNSKALAERRQTLIDIRKSAIPLAFPAYKPTDKPVGTRVGFGAGLTYMAQLHPEVVATSPDLQDSVHMFDLEKLAGRQTKSNATGAYFPEGISESNAAGKCAGLGMEGLIPFVATFDNFLLEAADELQHASAFGSFYVAVGTHSGCGVGPDGKSQMGVAMPAVIDHFSGVNGELFDMYEAADAQEAAEITKLIIEKALREGRPRHPVYLRCTRHNLGHLDRSVIPDYLKKLSEGSYTVPVKGAKGAAQIIIVASGATVQESLKAAQQLLAEGITAKVINVVSLNKIYKPTSPFVTEQLDDKLPIITVHDAEPNALGHRVKEAVNTARQIGRQPGIVMRSLGVNITPLAAHVGSGTSEENYHRNQLDAAGIVAVLKQVLNK